jgi:phosphotransferase system enzyme I (PtsI)
VTRRGVPASGGLASGPAHLVYPAEEQTPEDRELASGEVASEVRRFRLAVRRSLDEIDALRECLLGDPHDPGLKILDAHRMLLADPDFLRRVLDGVRHGRRPAGIMLHEVLNEIIRHLESARSEYFRARSADLLDVRRRVLKHLDGSSQAARPVPAGAVVVAVELTPSETASFDPEYVRGLVTDHGGPTSHAAILARSRGIPAVVGLLDLSAQVREGDRVLVDGHRGVVVVRPGRDELLEFEARRREAARRERAQARSLADPSVTLDGHPFTLLANIETAEDAPVAARSGAEGVGLYRTEFFYLKGPHLPDEEGQLRAYRRAVLALRPRSVVIRTLDAGGDKFAAYLGTTRETNPFLGVRGIRFSLGHPDIFRTQLRAILRAAAHGPVQILYPMISSLEEVREANRMVDEAAVDLRREGHAVPERVPRGVMIEVPAAVVLADLLAREVDFFSIGSNDLIQYTLAVDRANEKLASLYDPFHPAVLRSLAYTVDAANRVGIPVSSCGEMSGQPTGAAVLLGLGCTSLSMSPFQIPEVKSFLRRVRMVDLRRLATGLLRLATTEEVRAAVDGELGAALGPGWNDRGERRGREVET